MAPSVPFIDGGELATVCATLGIAHPTGYPLFSLIGCLFAHLPIAEHIIVRLNIMSVLFVALGSGAMVFLVCELCSFWFNHRVAKPQKKGKKSVAKVVHPTDSIEETKNFHASAAAIFAGLTMAFSATWWDTSTSVEVYPLHCFLVPVALIFFFRMLRLERDSFGKNSVLFALTLGLSFANHLTTILLAPAALYMFFATFGFKRDAFMRIVKLAIPFIIGLLPYLYFPIRASQYPIMDWGHPSEFGSFMRHFSGGQYKIWMFTKDAPAKNWPYFWGKFPAEFTIVGLILVLCGIYSLSRSSGRGKAHLLPFTVLLFFGCLLYSINFDILEINPYFLTAYIASAITATFGLIWLLKIAKEKMSLDITKSIVLSALIFSSLQIGMHYKEIDESGNYFVEDYTKNMLRNLPKDAIIFTSAWDFWASGAFYYQLVEQLRPDIFVIDVAMLRDRPWYYSHLKQRFPEVMKRAELELSVFMPYLVRFDRGETYNGEGIAETYKAFTEALVAKNLDRPIFLSPEVVEQRDPLFAPSFKPFSAGLAFRLLRQDSSLDVPLPKIEWHDKNYKDRSYYTDDARWLQAFPLAERAKVLAKKGRMAEAKQFLDLALTLSPDMTVNTETLRGRDRETADRINESFGRIEQFRKSLGR